MFGKEVNISFLATFFTRKLINSARSFVFHFLYFNTMQFFLRTVLFLLLNATIRLTLQAQPLTSISGKVLTYDGSPATTANVLLTYSSGDYANPIANFSVNQQAEYIIQIYNGGFYYVWFTAPNHEIFGVPIVVDSLRDRSEPIALSVQLKPHDYKPNIQQVRIIGDWNKFDFESAESMTPELDGTFSYQLKKTRAAYQLLDITQKERSVNGTMSDFFIYDGGGDYQSVVRAEKDSSLIIRFNPRQLPRTANAELPKAIFNARYQYLDDLARFQYQSRVKEQEANKAFEKWVQGGGRIADFTFDYGELPNQLLATLNDRTISENVRQILAVELLALPHFKPIRPTSIVESVEKLLAIGYSAWSLHPNSVLNYAKWKGEDQEKALRRFAAQSPDRNIQLLCIAELGLMAKTKGDTAKIREIYEGAVKDLSAFKEAELLLMELSPYKPTLEGKPIPPFELKTVNGKTISNKSFRGKFILLDFYMSWYQPTLDEREFIRSAFEKFKTKNLEIVSVSFDDKLSDAKAFLAKHPEMKWTQTFADKRFESDIAKRLALRAVPFPILISPDGKTLALGVSLRQYQLAETLAKFLK